MGPTGRRPAWVGSVAPAGRSHVHTRYSLIAAFFIVRNVPSALSFYRDFSILASRFKGPLDDIFFGIVQRGAAMIMFKNVGVDRPLRTLHQD